MLSTEGAPHVIQNQAICLRRGGRVLKDWVAKHNTM